jgi:hypothetical protein
MKKYIIYKFFLEENYNVKVIFFIKIKKIIYFHDFLNKENISLTK